ncbi:alpha/beta-hydrolase [Mollisia scopiformis]|uniref:Carboxylic ester hydrolase n=1 Tax=Mollisia scopiformis TaxID=149040 RepID=A0A132B1S7_MOLSC|nr:alpha/beta-hydrolase [Mollisia scopiformis]KUJ06338.1 alpha/beta-hydrolase [Mollisia scopiformis]
MAFLLYLALLCAQYASTWALPHVTTAQVNLGYQIHQGWLNTTGNFYNFSNIPYANPPVGNLRFSPPTVPNVPAKPPVDDGSRFALCPQGIPLWTPIVTDWLTNGIGVINQSAGYTIPYVTTLPTPLPGTSEDCLLLDILVPKTIFDNRGTGSGAPVLLWIHGGGYTLGWKTQYGSGAGLVAASQAHGKTGAIYIAINYRLGLFGFLSGPTFSSEGGTANNGLLDQRMALEWVQKNIHLFGGDPNRVTVMGESAGGGSTIHQVTAYGGLKGPSPFSQAIIQSGAFLPVPGTVRPERIYQKFLTRGNLTNLTEARAAPTEQLQLANAILVGEAPFGDFTFNPVVDGSFAPDLPGKLLLSGGYDHNLTLLVGHNDDEGLEFTSPFLPPGNETAFTENVILVSFPDAAATNATSYILDVLYPPIFDGSHGYTDEISRADYIVSEALFACNAEYLSRAFNTSAYAYDFSVPPALHGQDVPYTFYEGPATAVINDTLALIMQDYFTNFVIRGDPNGEGLVEFPSFGEGGRMLLDFFTDAVGLVADFEDNERCTWWQKALYY